MEESSDEQLSADDGNDLNKTIFRGKLQKYDSFFDILDYQTDESGKILSYHVKCKKPSENNRKCGTFKVFKSTTDTLRRHLVSDENYLLFNKLTFGDFDRKTIIVKAQKPYS